MHSSSSNNNHGSSFGWIRSLNDWLVFLLRVAIELLQQELAKGRHNPSGLSINGRSFSPAACRLPTDWLAGQTHARNCLSCVLEKSGLFLSVQGSFGTDRRRTDDQCPGPEFLRRQQHLLQQRRRRRPPRRYDYLRGAAKNGIIECSLARPEPPSFDASRWLAQQPRLQWNKASMLHADGMVLSGTRTSLIDELTRRRADKRTDRPTDRPTGRFTLADVRQPTMARNSHFLCPPPISCQFAFVLGIETFALADKTGARARARN